MINIWMDEYLYKSTKRSRDYNKTGEWMWMLMVTVMMAMMMKIMLLPPRILVDARSMPSVSLPFGCTPDARLHKFLVPLCVGSPFRLHRVGVSGEVKPPTPDTGGDTSGSAHMSAR
jgi:hypothetical protein